MAGWQGQAGDTLCSSVMMDGGGEWMVGFQTERRGEERVRESG